MDTVIEAEVKKAGRKRTAVIIGLSVLVMIAAIWVLRVSLHATLKRSEITTAVAERGDIENTINASGQVLPEFEETVSSPIDASVQKIIMEEGSKVQPGESILTLDKSASQTEYEKLKFQLESKQNDIQKLKLDLEKSFYDIRSNNDIKQLTINSLEADVENAKRLYNAGGGTRDDIDKAELNLKVAKLEKQQLENEIKNKQQTMQIEIKQAEIEAAIQQNDLDELERKLQLANIVASRQGVVTWVNKNIGAKVREGEPLARIADLSSFKVQGSISDNYLDALHNGMTAIVRINETQIRGKVVNIQPSVQNGVVLFDVALDENNDKLLHPDMKVDVYLVTSAGSNVLRVANGPAFRGAAFQDIFVVVNGKAERRKAEIGMTNFDYVQIKSGANVGDVVITSDMSEFRNVHEITINN